MPSTQTRKKSKHHKTKQNKEKNGEHKKLNSTPAFELTATAGVIKLEFNR